MDFCDSENRNHIVETEKQLLETGLSREFEEDLNMAIGEDDTEDRHEKHEEDSIDNEDSEQDSENESVLSDENLTQNNSEEMSSEETNMINIESKKYAANEKDEIVNEELSNVSEQSDDNNEGLWEDIYGRQRDKEGNIVSKKYVPPAGRIASNNISSNNEKIHRLEKQLKGILNRLAEQNMHTIANQVISH